MRKNYLGIMLGILAGLIAGCSGGSPDNSTPIDPPIVSESEPTDKSVGAEKARLKEGLSCTEYKEYVANSIGDSYFENYYGPVDWLANGPVNLEGDAFDGPSVSGTNNQEVGVDEADIVKVDSTGLLYFAQQNKITIAKGFPVDQLEIIFEIEFSPPFDIKEMILHEQSNRLAVISYPYYNATPLLVDTNALLPPTHTSVGTFIKFFDITDPSAPLELKQLSLSGFIDQSRLVNAQLLALVSEDTLTPTQRYEYFDSNQEFSQVLSNYFQAVNDQDTELADQLELQGRELISEIISQIDVGLLLPSVNNIVDGQPWPVDALDCEDIYVSDLSVRYGLTTAYRVSMDGDYLEGLAAVTSFSSSAYISDDNIYLYQLSSNWWFLPDQVDETAIHQISYSTDLLDYKGSGLVPGSIRNRFSLSEYQDDLRVATTETIADQNSGNFLTRNYMSVLRPDNQGKLDIIGSSRTYADNESIFSARFVQDRAYVVTFRQIDPLFTFDLSIPTSPQIMGELKIPGFSEYIHPMGADRLITIGRNGDDAGLLPGVNFQLFDVSDLANPILLHSYVPTDSTGEVGYAWSIASYEHRAFTYVDQKNLLVVPFVINQSASTADNFSGFLAMEVNDANGFSEIGRIDHDNLLGQCSTALSPLEDNCMLGGLYSATPLRSAVIGDANDTVIYTFSNLGIQADPLLQIGSSTSSIVFTEF